MVGNISAQVIDEIRSRSDIVEVLSHYLPLNAKGKNYYGLCPFHTEKTPSFAVNPEKQIFHCFGCGVGGDVFGFLMKKEGLSFVEAVRLLAGQCGVVIAEEEQTPQAIQKLKNRQKLFEINKAASEYFQGQLQTSIEGKKAAQYLVERGISLEIQKQFEVGYAPSGWENLSSYMQGKGYQPVFLEKAGLIVKRQNQDGFYDRFRERITFPIYDYRNGLIGFGGRSLDEDKNPPKYLNSPETPIYHKGESFYGLNWSKDAIRKAGSAIIVEGYLDYIALQQAGIENVVASLGTAFTQQQAQLISHYASEVILFFDADVAGAKAAVRSFPLFLGSKLRVKVAQVPAGSDPDSFVRLNGAQALSVKIAEAVSLVDFVLTEAVKEINVNTVGGQLEAANKVLPLLAQLPNAMERASYLGKVSQRLGIKEQLLLKELEKAVAKRQRTLAVDKSKFSTIQFKAAKVAQERLLTLMLREERYLEAGLTDLEKTDFTVPEYEEVFLVLQNLGPGTHEIAVVLRDLGSEEARNFVAKVALLEMEKEFEHPQQCFDDCLRTLNRNRLREQLQALHPKALLDRKVQSQYIKLQKQLKC